MTDLDLVGCFYSDRCALPVTLLFSWFLEKEEAMAAGEVVKDSPASVGITGEESASKLTTATRETTKATTPATKVTKAAFRRTQKGAVRNKFKAISTKDNAKIRGKNLPNRFSLQGCGPDEVGDPTYLVVTIEKDMAASNEFDNSVRDRMLIRHEIFQLSQEQGVDFDLVFAQQQAKGKAEELALTDMDGSFPALPPCAMETAPLTAVVDDPVPPSTAATPSFASKLRSSSSSAFFRGKATLSANIEGLNDFSIETFAEDCSTLNVAAWNGLTRWEVPEKSLRSALPPRKVWPPSSWMA